MVILPNLPSFAKQISQVFSFHVYRFVRIFLFCLLLSTAAFAQEKWESAIQKFEKEDRETPPPPAPIVFVGSSSFAFWTAVQASFPGKPILNRGFGGSELSDALHFADRVILAYQPKQVVIYAGENDLAVGSKNAVDVYRLFVRLFTKLRTAQPALPVAYVAIKPSPSRWKLKPEMDKTNRLIRRYLRRQRNADFIDVVPVMLDPTTQRPKPGIFKPDSLHMNAEGYQLWASLLRPILR